jgi:hypothetical protein
MAGFQRFLLWAAAVGTLLLTIAGAAMGLAATGPPPIPVIFFFIVAAVWMLSPYWGALNQQRGAATPAEAIVVLAASVLVVALGAYAYLAGWVFYEGPTRATGQGMLALIIPLYQWVILGIAFGLRWVVRRVARVRDRRHVSGTTKVE